MKLVFISESPMELHERWDVLRTNGFVERHDAAAARNIPKKNKNRQDWTVRKQPGSGGPWSQRRRSSRGLNIPNGRQRPQRAALGVQRSPDGGSSIWFLQRKGGGIQGVVLAPLISAEGGRGRRKGERSVCSSEAQASTGPSAPASRASWCDRTAVPPGTGRTRSARSSAGCSSWRARSSPVRRGPRSPRLAPPAGQRRKL